MDDQKREEVGRLIRELESAGVDKLDWVFHGGRIYYTSDGNNGNEEPTFLESRKIVELLKDSLETLRGLVK